MHLHVHPIQPQAFKSVGQNVTVLAWSETLAALSPHISNLQLYLDFWGRRQELGQMSKVVSSLDAKAMIVSRTVHLKDEQSSVIKSIFRAFVGVQYWYIEHNIPHHLQF